jgi:hypothetical protein
MARYTGEYPGDWKYKDGESWEDYDARCKAMLDAIPKDKILRFPIADGQALYFIEKMKPLTLQHIPYGDAWHIPGAHMKGLTAADAERMIDWGQKMSALFAKQAEENEVISVVLDKTYKPRGDAKYTRLRKIFATVCNPKDWKGPIRTVVTKDQLQDVEQAIVFMTGTVCRVIKQKNGKYLIVSVGYRLGPCGDH